MIPLDFSAKEFGMVYVGHSKFRWGPMHRILAGVEPVRDKVGRIALVGEGWGSRPSWPVPTYLEHSYFSDASYLRRLGIELMPPVHFEQVISTMSRAVINPVITRPTFGRLRLVTPRLFETLAANTLPLFGLEPDHVQEIYGDEALDLTLPCHSPEEKILDMICRPKHYSAVVERIRNHLRQKHSHTVRINELIDLIRE
jgi:hypothetical protein